MITSAIAIVLVFGGLIFFHELGHFAVARLFGMGVKAFSLGFGPKIIGTTSGKTEYKLSAIPLGGYVALAGEQGEEEEEFDEDELFANRPAWQRLCVVAAGPLFNFLLAFLIFWFMVVAQGQGTLLATAGKIMPDSAAQEAGLQTGDRITQINDTQIDSWDTMVQTIRQAGEQPLTVRVDREGETLTLHMTPRIKTLKTMYGEQITIPVIGVEMGHDIEYHPVAGLGIIPALKQTWYQSLGVIKGFKNIIKRMIPMDQVGGPIMLAQVIHDGAQSGIFQLLFRAAVISINLAILNLLPIPVLDGGHIVFNVLEIIFRRPISDKWKARAMRIGILLLLLLMSLAIFNDVRRLFS